MTDTPPPLKYSEPPGASVPPRPLKIEVLKGGTMLRALGPFAEKSFLVLGRLPVCDIELEHPSVSRYHAVVQFSLLDEQVEAKLFDLGSSHGTFLNKVLLSHTI